MTEKLDPVGQKDFEQISPRAKKILFNHGSLLLQKYDPKLHDNLQHYQENATQTQLMEENLEQIKRMKMPVLKLNSRHGGPNIFYSEKSLKNLAVNDSTYLMKD